MEGHDKKYFSLFLVFFLCHLYAFFSISLLLYFSFYMSIQLCASVDNFATKIHINGVGGG